MFVGVVKVFLQGFWMKPHKTVALLGDCHAAMVPVGTPILLTEGMEVAITQSLGGQVTVLVGGNLARIAGEDAKRVLGEAYQAPEEVSLPEGASITDWAWAMMATCYDPEISVNIVELGLIYGCEATEFESGRFRVHVCMTLTAPGCGMGPVIVEDVKQKIMQIDQVYDVVVELVFDPPWHQGLMGEVARLELGLI